MLDREHYPNVSAYLDGLPSGLSSHPTCRAKATLYRALLDYAPLTADDLERLPPALVDLAEHPPPVSSWVPEVHSHAMMLAVYDRSFPDIEAFARHAYSSQRALFAGPLYAVALRFASPELLIKTAALRWRLFHRGMTFKAIVEGDGYGRIQVEYPVGIYEPILLRALCEAIRAVLDLSTGSHADVPLLRCEPTGATLGVRWHEK